VEEPPDLFRRGLRERPGPALRELAAVSGAPARRARGYVQRGEVAAQWSTSGEATWGSVTGAPSSSGAEGASVAAGASTGSPPSSRPFSSPPASSSSQSLSSSSGMG